MAKVVITDQQAIAESWAMWVRTIVLGAGVGLVFWVLTILIGRYVIEPIACGRVVNAALCADPKSMAGNISAILTSLIGLIAMVRIGASRPIVVAVATAALLWDFAAWTNGLFWLEAISWSVILYALTYALFAWITRYAVLWATIVISVLIVSIIRIALVL